MLNKILSIYSDVEFLKVDGFDSAIIGVDVVDFRLIYSIPKCVEILSAEMTEEDALEYLYYNKIGAYVGEKTPIWCLGEGGVD